MNHVQYINTRLKDQLSKCQPTVLFGQNISTGSCLSGLTKGIETCKGARVLNTPNMESTLVGVGFGLMLNHVSSVFFMKQQDFLLLGIDQMVNTYNYVRLDEPRASFTIVTIVVDLGYQGIQSSLNNCGDFCSTARIPGYTISNRQDTDYIIKNKLVSPGFRILGVSQRLFGTELLDIENPVQVSHDGAIFQYFKGDHLSIICFNFSFPQGIGLCRELGDQGIQASLFSVNHVYPADWTSILEDVRRTKNAVLIDDSKTGNLLANHLAKEIYQQETANQVVVFSRDCSDDDLRPNSEEFHIEARDILCRLNVK